RRTPHGLARHPAQSRRRLPVPCPHAARPPHPHGPPLAPLPRPQPPRRPRPPQDPHPRRRRRAHPGRSTRIGQALAKRVRNVVATDRPSAGQAHGEPLKNPFPSDHQRTEPSRLEPSRLRSDSVSTLVVFRGSPWACPADGLSGG